MDATLCVALRGCSLSFASFYPLDDLKHSLFQMVFFKWLKRLIMSGHVTWDGNGRRHLSRPGGVPVTYEQGYLLT